MQSQISANQVTLSMTPLIDVVLLLLIFYIVTTAFVDREIELKLPEADASTVPEEKKKYTIELDKSGKMAMNGEVMTLSHSGGQRKTSTFLLCAPDYGTAVALMCNTSGTGLGGLAGEILELLIESQDR